MHNGNGNSDNCSLLTQTIKIIPAAPYSLAEAASGGGQTKSLARPANLY